MLVENVALAMCRAAGFDEEPGLVADQARAAIEAVFDWLAGPGEAAIIAGFEEYPAIWTAAITDEDRVGIWTAMLAAKRKEALG